MQPNNFLVNTEASAPQTEEKSSPKMWATSAIFNKFTKQTIAQWAKSRPK
jgi:hypothetical protein